MTIQFQNLSLVRKAKTTPLQFIQELEGLRDPESLNALKKLLGVLDGVQWIMCRGLPDFASSPPQRRGLTQNQENRTLKKSHNL